MWDFSHCYISDDIKQLSAYKWCTKMHRTFLTSFWMCMDHSAKHNDSLLERGSLQVRK